MKHRTRVTDSHVLTCAHHSVGQGEDPAAGHLTSEEHAGRDDPQPTRGHGGRALAEGGVQLVMAHPVHQRVQR